MREIKFRVWDGAMKEMLGENDASWTFHNMNYKPYGSRDLMQYTGLKDKNGVEIYEGDILEFDGQKLNPVEFEYCEFIARPFALSPQAPNSQEVFEVIGNIHENPELVAT